MTPLEEVLDLARWAPSGDNTQPWRFAIEGADRVVVYGADTRAHCVYDLDGHPSQISIGALLETIVIAATRFGLAARVVRRDGTPEEHPVFDVTFTARTNRTEDPLAAHIRARTTQRRPMSRRRLTLAQKGTLAQAVVPGYSLQWFEGPRARAKIAWLDFKSAHIRLTIPEAYEVHRSVIEWDADVSEDRVPAGALGAGRASLRMMRWALASWQRVDRLNRFAAGTLMPRLELDLVPGLACAAHVVLIAMRAPRTLDDYVAAGRALQRLWLTATSLGLQFQPEYTPLIFARYAREGVRFTTRARALREGAAIRWRVERLLGPDVAERAVFMGRLGIATPVAARSARLPLDQLMVERNAGAGEPAAHAGSGRA